MLYVFPIQGYIDIICLQNNYHWMPHTPLSKNLCDLVPELIYSSHRSITENLKHSHTEKSISSEQREEKLKPD